MDPFTMLMLAQGMGSVGGALFGQQDAETIKNFGFGKKQKKSKLAFLNQLGPEFLEPYKLSKKQAKGLGKTEKVKFGGQVFRVPTDAELDTVVAQQETQALNQAAETMQKLADSPLYQSVAQRAAGNFGEFDERLLDGFSQLSSRALGSQSPRGTLTNPAVAARALGPMALQRANILNDLQLRSEDQLRSAALGLPFSQSAQGGYMPQGSMFNAFSQHAAGHMGGQQFNALQQTGANSFNAGLLSQGIGGLMMGGLGLMGGFGASSPGPGPTHPSTTSYNQGMS